MRALKLKEHVMKNRTYIFTRVIMSIFLMWGCDVDDPEHQPTALTVGDTYQSECKPMLNRTSTSTSTSNSNISADVNGSTVTIWHRDAYYNCAAKFKFDLVLSGQSIEATEVILNPNEVAKCVCYFDLSFTLNNLAAGTYSVTIFDIDNKPVGSVSFTIAD
jgi:hypothetical protein